MPSLICMLQEATIKMKTHTSSQREISVKAITPPWNTFFTFPPLGKANTQI